MAVLKFEQGQKEVPGVSFAATVVFLIAFPHATIALKVSSEVWGVRITSSSFITKIQNYIIERIYEEKSTFDNHFIKII